MVNEEWRDIPGYEGKYQISIRTKECLCKNINYRGTGKSKIIPNTVNRDGRVMWNLTNDGVKYNKQAAYWVAITFPELIENEYFEGAEIDHKDTDRLNNQPFNLRWVTRRGNCLNPLTRLHNSSSQKGRIISDTTKDRISASQKKRLAGKPELSGAKNYVLQFTLNGEYITTYQSTNEAERLTGIPHQNISKACCGKYLTSGGYKWKYKEKEAV